MSMLNALAQPRTEPRRRPERALRPVTAPAPRRRPTLACAALAVGGALAIGAAQMAISLASTQDAFVLAKLNSQQRELTLQKQALGDELVGLNSPQALASKADAMGLVVAGSAAYLRLSDAAVLGAPAGADWISTVTPNSGTKVGNALLAPRPPTAAEQQAAEQQASAEQASEEGSGTTGADPDLPPVITDGLPSPTTR